MVRKYTDALVHLHRVNTTCLAENIAYLILVRNSDIFWRTFFVLRLFFATPLATKWSAEVRSVTKLFCMSVSCGTYQIFDGFFQAFLLSNLSDREFSIQNYHFTTSS